MSTIRLLHGPCDPRDVEMTVTTDAVEVRMRVMPLNVFDVYVVTERFIEDNEVKVATGEYSHTEGNRTQLTIYRKQLARIGAGRAFAMKRKKQGREVTH